ncbi:MAG TPA: c-type cytochrome [Bdellovibrionota bacterium]|nr:c-type cytochrome [Bdellovibrionota bacterium]
MSTTRRNCIRLLQFILAYLLMSSGSIFALRAQEAATSASPWPGREVFHQKGCAQCHSVYGRGGRGGPDLGNRKFYGTYLELSSVMWNHLPRMAKKIETKGYAFPKFTPKEMSELVRYLSFIRYMAEPVRESMGRKVLKEKGCFSCHQFGGEGARIAPDISAKKEYISPIRLAEAMWNHGPKMLALFEKYKIDRPVIEEDEMDALAAGIRSYMAPTVFPASDYDLGDPSKGKELLTEKGCMHCHSFRAKPPTTAPDFAEVDFNYPVTEIAAKMWNHGPAMWEMMKEKKLTFPDFKEGEMAHVIAYLYSMKLEDAPGSPATGENLVRDRECLTCHSLNGKGRNAAKDFAAISKLNSPMGMVAAMWNHSTEMQEKHTEQHLKWPKLTGREMADLYAFLTSLAPASPNAKHLP